MPISIFRGISAEEKNKAIKKLINWSLPTQTFFLLIGLAVSMATMGILLNSETIIIGSTLVAPLLYPVLSFSMSIVMSDFKIMRESLFTLGKAIILGASVSFIISLFSQTDKDYLSGMINHFRPSLLYFGVSFIAGFVATLALIKDELNETLPGVSISVALLPPLSAVGIGIANFSWQIIQDATLLFLLNFMGVVFASMIVFSLTRFFVKKTLAHKILEGAKLKEE